MNNTQKPGIIKFVQVVTILFIIMGAALLVLYIYIFTAQPQEGFLYRFFQGTGKRLELADNSYSLSNFIIYIMLIIFPALLNILALIFMEKRRSVELIICFVLMAVSKIENMNFSIAIPIILLIILLFNKKSRTYFTLDMKNYENQEIVEDHHEDKNVNL